jgi:hypothetical protein
MSKMEYRAKEYTVQRNTRDSPMESLVIRRKVKVRGHSGKGRTRPLDNEGAHAKARWEARDCVVEVACGRSLDVGCEVSDTKVLGEANEDRGVTLALRESSNGDFQMRDPRLIICSAVIGAAVNASCGGAGATGADSGPSGDACPPGYECIGLDASTDAGIGVRDGRDSDASVDAGVANDGFSSDATSANDASLQGDAGHGQEAGLQQDAADAGGLPEGSSGGTDAMAPAPTPSPPSPLVVVGYRVVDAEQSAALSSIVMVSDTPTNTLHIFNQVTQQDRSIPLPAAPVAVAVDPSGLNAAVAYDAHVSSIDLQAATIRTTCALSSNAYDLALTRAGSAYVVPRTDQWVSLHSINLSTCSETMGTTLRAGSHIALHPSEVAVFTADQGLSPSRITRCDISGSSPSCTDAQGGADWGTYSYCGNLWISADGQRIYTACGVTLRVPGNVNGSSATYGGTLNGVTSVAHMSEGSFAQQVALIPGSTDTMVRIHETAFLGFVKQVNIPAFPLPDGGSTTAHGRFVFTTSAVDMLYVVVQADSSSGALNDFAIASFRP